MPENEANLSASVTLIFATRYAFAMMWFLHCGLLCRVLLCRVLPYRVLLCRIPMTDITPKRVDNRHAQPSPHMLAFDL
jgi:hypothetical protein